MNPISGNQHGDPASLAAGCLMASLQLLWVLVSSAFQTVWILASILFSLPLGVAAVLFILLLFFFM